MTSIVTESLRLRRWALSAFASADSIARSPPCATTSWRHFLSVERCALPLKTRLQEADAYERLDPDARAVLDKVASVELQRVLSARGHLLLIDRLAAEHGWDVVVLKGGVAAWKDQGALDLEDLDVLANPDDGRALAAALDAAGHEAAGPSSPLHLEGRSARGALKIEVHTKIDMVGATWPESVWAGARHFDGATCLKRLGSRDHLWHELVHVGVLHPYRRGAIRDLLLLSQALLQCSEHDLDEVRRQLTHHPLAGVLRAMLSTASGMSGAAQVQDHVVRHAAIAHFVSRHGQWLPLPEWLSSEVGKWAVAFPSGWADMKLEWDRVRMVTIGPSKLSPVIARFERRVPRLGRAVRVTTRATRAILAALLAIPLAAGAACTARRVCRQGC